MSEFTARLTRVTEQSKNGMFGVIHVDDLELFTCERPWLGNQPFVSCIPEGEYVLKPRRYNRGGYDAYEVMNVEGRTHILLHKGNRPTDLAGCIAPGVWFGNLSGDRAVVSSGVAFALLMDVFAGRTGRLIIRGVESEPSGISRVG